MLGEFRIVRNFENESIGLVQRFDRLIHIVVFPILLRRVGECQRIIEHCLIVIDRIFFHDSGIIFIVLVLRRDFRCSGVGSFLVGDAAGRNRLA